MFALRVVLLACTLATVLGTPTPDLVLGRGPRATNREYVSQMPSPLVDAGPQDLSLRTEAPPAVTRLTTITITVPSSTITRVVTATPLESFSTTILSQTTVFVETTEDVFPSESPTTVLSIVADSTSTNDAIGLTTRYSSTGHWICWMMALMLLAFHS